MSIDAVGRTFDATSVSQERKSPSLRQAPVDQKSASEIGAGGSERKKSGQTDKVSESRVEQAIADLNKGTELAQKRLHFSLHKETDRLVVRVVDTETDEVIREIPPEEVLDAAAKLRDLIGLLLDERV